MNNQILNDKFIEEHSTAMIEHAPAFLELMMRYRCALKEVETKLQVLNDEFSLKYDRNPFDTIKSRLKSPKSLFDKMRRREIPITVENIENQIFDVAGIRVICSFPEDIYQLEQLLIRQDDIVVVERKDYIKNPKSNGYRSLHLIMDVPIFLSSEKRYMKVEVQFRTIAMDFWASVEHKLKYKKEIENGVYVANELADCAKAISDMDYRMQNIRNLIDNNKSEEELNV